MTEEIGTLNESMTFQSTSFTRRMTVLTPQDGAEPPISIHILHTKDDALPLGACGAALFQSTSFIRRMTRIQPIIKLIALHFNPHPSYEGWHVFDVTGLKKIKFQSTSFIRRMTCTKAVCRGCGKFQSTSFIRRMTYRRCNSQKKRAFQSTSFIRRMTTSRFREV